MKFASKAKTLVVAAGLVSVSLVTNSVMAVQAVDPDLEEYKKASRVAGNLSSVGSDTLANLMT